MCRHPLAADIFLYIRRIAEIMPVWREFGTQAGIPGEMIGDIVHVEKERPVAALALDNPDGLIEIETIGLEVRGAEISYVQIMRDADRRLEGARAEKGTVEWIEAEGLVAATAQ